MTKTKKTPVKKVIRPGKDITAAKADNLKTKLNKTIAQGVMELTLDCAAGKAIDPVGLSVIIAAHNTLKDAGGKLILKNVSDEFLNLFAVLRLDQHFDLQ